MPIASRLRRLAALDSPLEVRYDNAMRSTYARCVQLALLFTFLWMSDGLAADGLPDLQDKDPLPAYDFDKLPDVLFRAIRTADGLPDLQDKDPLPTYDFNKPPAGLFLTIQTAEGFDEELGYRRTHEIVPVQPTDVFRPSSPAVYIVFNVHQHYQPYQVFGICYPEKVSGLDPKTLIAQDTMYMALEDESGYVKLVPPAGGWKPGQYKVEIHVGFSVTELSLMGTMRFTVVPKP